MRPGRFIYNFAKDLSAKWSTIFTNKYSKAGISWAVLKQLRATSDSYENSFVFQGHPFFYSNSNEVLHAVDEIFLQQLYKSDIQTETPFIIDCGAHIGMSVLYFKTCFPKAEVLAFEPDPKNFAFLKKNVASYHLENVSLLQEAVWKEDGMISFNTEGSMSSKIEGTAKSTEASVKATRLKNHIKRKVDFLKIDIEGAEFFVLQDIESDLHFVDRLFLEYHGSFLQNAELITILNILLRNNFKFYIKEANPSYITPLSRQANIPEYDVQLNIFAFKD